MTVFANGCAWRADADGTGDFVVAAALTGYKIPADLNDPAVVDGGTYNYRAWSNNRTQYEVGQGTYDVASSTLARTTIYESSNANAVVNFVDAPMVLMGISLAQDAAAIGGNSSGSITTDNTTPQVVDTTKAITYVTTDGSGLEQEIQLPTNVLGSADDGRTHLIILQTRAHASDVLKITGAQYGGLSVYLRAVDEFGMFRWGFGPSGPGFWNFTDGFLNAGDAPAGVYVRDNFGALQIQPDPGIFFTYQAINLATSSATPNASNYGTRYITDGSGTPYGPVAIADGVLYGQRKFINIDTLTTAGDEISFVTTNLLLSGSQPSSVVFDAQQETLVMEWTIDPAGMVAGYWNIQQASPGVVTP